MSWSLDRRLRPFRLAPVLLGVMMAACGGGGGDGGGFTPPVQPPTPPPPPPPPPPSGNATISGKVEFRRPTLRTGSGGQVLDYSNLEALPARGVTVEIIRSSDSAVLATTATDASGNYSAQVASGQVFVRARAQLRSTTAGAAFDFEVRDNTSGNAMYALDSAALSASGATTVNLLADVTLPGQVLGTGDRPAGPFAILDMLWRARQLIEGAQPVDLPALDVYWSTANSSAQAAAPCADRPNPVTGEIGTTFYLNGTIQASGGCPAVPAGIYVLGDYSGDSDEFDPSVIAHEFGHYYEDKLSRSESMGGPHGLADRADFRLAYSEGWGNAFSGMVLDSPVYRDTFTTGGQVAFQFSMEADASNGFAGSEGWYSEASVGELLWDVYDGANDDPVALGFGAIDTMMRGPMRTSEALGTIYVAFAGLAAANGAAAAGLDQLLTGEAIAGRGDFGVGESNDAGFGGLLPLYRPVTLGVAQNVVSTTRFAATGTFASYSAYNRAGGRAYLLLDVPTPGSYQVTVTGPVGGDPDFQIFRNGQVVCEGFADSRATGQEVRTCAGLATGQHVIEVYECSNLGFPCSDDPPRGETTLAVTVIQQ